MGLRRRRKKLTSVITNVDKRLKAVEFRHVPTRIKAASITTEEIADGTIPPEDPKDSGATGSTASETAPSEFATLVSAAYSSRIITGSVDRVDIVTTQPHGFAVGDKITVHGVNNSDVDLSGTYKVTEVPSTTEFRYTRGLTGPYPTVINPVIKYAVTSKMATLTEAGLVLSGVGPTGHGFKVGEAITISGVGDPFDGTFLISDISDDHIYYKFATPISASISWTSATGYANATVHKYAIIGDTWIDTSVTPSVVKVWSGLAWVSPSELPEGVIVNDHMAPKAPTNLRATMRGYYSSDGTPRVQATLSWDAPTQNADDSPLTDLGGYKVFHKVTEEIEETTPAADGGEAVTDPAEDGQLSGTFGYFSTRGVATTVTLSSNAGTIYPTTFTIPSSGRGSHAWTVSGLTATESVTVSWTAVDCGSGSVTGALNTLVTSGAYTPPSNTANEVYDSFTITGRTQPTNNTPTPPENPTPTENQWESDADTIETSTIIRDLPMDSQVMFMVQAYDSSKLNLSTGENVLTISTGKPSQVLFTPSKPTLEARLGTLTVTWDGQDTSGSTPPPQLDHVDVHIGTTSGFTVGPDNLKGRIEPGIEGYLVIPDLAYNSTWYAKLVFISKTGVSTPASVASDPATVVSLVNTDLIANTLSTWPFQNGTVDLNALASGSVDASKIVANAVTQNAIAANAIGAVQIIAGAVGAGKIAANAITANEIAANTITAGMLKANSVEADKIKAGALDAFLITGAQIQTAATGGRIVLISTGLTAYASNGTTPTFSIAASTGNVSISGYLTVGGAASDVNNGSVTIGGGKITANTISATQIKTDYVYAGTIQANQITAGTLTGFTINTASSGQRVQLSGSNIKFYNSGAVDPVGTIYGSSYGSNNATYIDTPAVLITNGGGNGKLFILGETGIYDGILNISNTRIYNANAGNYSMDLNGDMHSDKYWAFGSANGWHRSYFDSTSNFFQTSSSYDRTYSSAANAYVTTNGVIGRATSATKYKILIEEKTNYDFTKILDLKPKTWIDKTAAEGYAARLSAIYAGEEVSDFIDNEPIERFSGLIAEDLIEAGLEDYVSWGRYKEDGTREAEGIQYDRLWTCLIPIVKDLRDRLALLETPE